MGARSVVCMGELEGSESGVQAHVADLFYCFSVTIVRVDT